MPSISNYKNFEQNCLNTKFQNIGKYTSNGWVCSKSFFAFDKDGHLNIRQLNPLQILARRFFGMFPDSTLKNVIHHWNEFQIKHGNVCPELSEKLATLWMKNHSEQILLPIEKAFFIGNSNIENAEVIGIGQLFSHPDNPNFCGEVLSKHYRTGDVILVEGIDAERTLSSTYNFQTALMTPSTDVFGWEPVGYEALNAQVYGPTTTYSSTWTTVQNNFFRNTWDIRQQSLLNEIDYYRQLGKRVFVCAGAAHFYPNKGQNESPVISALKQHKFTIGLSNIRENATYYSFDALTKKYN